MSDQGFPIIRYAAEATPRQRGQAHGESFREGIAQLASIRRALMFDKNPTLTPATISTLAEAQWQATVNYDSPLTEELTGIREGAGVSLDEIVILNNYTDFRDIHVGEQGCSVVFVARDGRVVCGQTWDMHRSAKDYVCCIEVPEQDGEHPMVVFSVVGCVGMMGFHPRGAMVGVNNLPTNGAKAGILWPCLVRRTLGRRTVAKMVTEVTSAQVTSGHGYLVADRRGGEFWEVLPGLAERVGRHTMPDDGFLFHTNHCLGPQSKRRQLDAAISATTFDRFDLIEKKIASAATFEDVVDLLNDHENYPKSICSNFETGASDPSATCGGAVADLESGRLVMWRGDQLYDENFVSRSFQLEAPRVA